MQYLTRLTNMAAIGFDNGFFGP
ncbi:hypothetical protein YPPY56_2629, partial [Yersinia pestis PY-56]